MSGYEWLCLYGRNGTFYTHWENDEPVKAGDVFFWSYWDTKKRKHYPRTLEATAYDKSGNIGLFDVHTGERIIIENNHFIEVRKSVERFC